MPEPQTPPAKDTTGAAAGTAVAEPPKPAAAAPGAAPAAAPAASAPQQGSQGQPAEIKLAMPKDSLLDAGAVERIASFAKERGLTQEQAQAILERESGAVAAYAEGQQQTLEKHKSAWVEDLKADKELGGAAFNETVEIAKRVVESFGTEALKKALNETGLGNHPEVVRVFARIGKQMGDDKFVRPTAGAGVKRSPEEIFYPEQPKTEA